MPMFTQKIQNRLFTFAMSFGILLPARSNLRQSFTKNLTSSQWLEPVTTLTGLLSASSWRFLSLIKRQIMQTILVTLLLMLVKLSILPTPLLLSRLRLLLTVYQILLLIRLIATPIILTLLSSFLLSLRVFCFSSY